VHPAALNAHSTSEEQREKKRVRQRRSAMSEEQREKKNEEQRKRYAAMRAK